MRNAGMRDTKKTLLAKQVHSSPVRCEVITVGFIPREQAEEMITVRFLPREQAEQKMRNAETRDPEIKKTTLSGGLHFNESVRCGTTVYRLPSTNYQLLLLLRRNHHLHALAFELRKSFNFPVLFQLLRKTQKKNFTLFLKHN